MRRIYFWGVWVMLFCGMASAADDPGHKIVMQGGSQGATACQACHGENGAGMSRAGYPKLAGLQMAYIEHQLNSYRNGDRNHPVMKSVAKKLTKKEIAQVAQYYSEQKVKSAPTQYSNALIAKGRYIATHGHWNDEVPACISCHAPEGEGVQDSTYFAPLAGQHGPYIISQLKAWRSGQRHSDPLKLMESVAKGLDESDIEAVAAYFASLPTMDVAAVDKAQAKLIEQGEYKQDSNSDSFSPPSVTEIPESKFGKVVKKGRDIFVNTQEHASEYIGNDLACANCHLNEGRLGDSAPMWGAWGMYPAYRGKNDRVNTMADRIQGCFMYSMNGEAPPKDSDVMTALQSYMYWLSQGVPTGKQMPGRGYPSLDEPAKAPDAHRGETVYQANCALCHGESGQGRQAKGGDRYVFPPLWGSGSYNWGAGMHRIATAASFIHANMPLGRGGELLTEQQAWDVAAFIDHQPRPQDPRFTGDVEQTKKQFHNHVCEYGQVKNGFAN